MPSIRRPYQPGGLSPVPREAGICSRHEKIFRVGFEVSVENFFRKKVFEKFPTSSRITAGPLLFQRSKVILNLALGQGGRKPSGSTVAWTIPCGKRRIGATTSCWQMRWQQWGQSTSHNEGRPRDRYEWRDAPECSTLPVRRPPAGWPLRRRLRGPSVSRRRAN